MDKKTEQLFAKALKATKRKPVASMAAMLGAYDGPILEGLARGPYASAWGDKQEEKNRSLSGMDIYVSAPKTPSFAKKWARELRQKILNLNTVTSLTELYEIAVSRGYTGDPETFGYHLGMQSIGHGVSWKDDADYKKTSGKKDINLPHAEFYY